MSSSPDSFETAVRITVDASGVATEVEDSKNKADELTRSLEETGAAADEAGSKLSGTAANVAEVGTASQESAAKMDQLAASLKQLNDMGSAGSSGDMSGPLQSARELAMVQKEYHSQKLNDIAAERIAENQLHQANIENIRATGSATREKTDMNKSAIQAAIQGENDRHRKELSNIADKKSAAESENRTRTTQIQRLALTEKEGAERVAAAKKEAATQAKAAADEEKRVAREIADAKKAAAEEAKAAAKAEREERERILELEKRIAAERKYNSSRTPASDLAAQKQGLTVPASSSTTTLAAKPTTALVEERKQFEALTKAQEDQTRGLANARYALYDVAATWRMVGIAATGASAAMVATAASFESAFTGVERTVDVPVEEMGRIRDDLIALSANIPESFPDLSNIATIGGQLDIAGSNIVSFTENVAKFSAMTDASIDDTAMSFGRIDQLANNSVGSFQSIASAVYDVGVQTVATETQIMKMSQEISATASLAGFTAQEVIGLSGALASLGVQPERARGAIQKSFALISTAVDEGGTELVKFADIAHMSADEFASAWGSEPANVFKTFLTGLSSIQNLDTALADLGLNDLRVADMFKRLSGNMDVVNQAMDVSSNAWTDHSAFMEAYGLVADDLASKMKMLANDILALIDSLANNAALGGFVDQIRNVITVVQSFADGLKQVPVIGPIFSSAIPMVLGLTGAMALLKAGQLTLRASAYAMITAQTHMSKNAAFADMKYRDLIRTLFGLDGASKKAAASGNALATSTHNAGNAASVATGKWSAASVSMGRLTTSISAGSKAMLGLVGGWTGLAVIAGAGAFSLLGKYMNETRQEAEALAQSFQGVSEAVAHDTSIYERTGEAIRVLTLSQEGIITSSNGVKTSQGELLDVMHGVAGAVGFATAATEEYTLALGANTQQALVNALTQNEKLMELFMNMPPILKEMGLDAQGFSEAMLNGTVPEYMAQIYDNVERVKGSIQETLDSVNDSGGEAGEVIAELTAELYELEGVTSLLEGAMNGANDAILRAAVTNEFAVGAGLEAADAMDYEAASALNLADSMIAALEGPMAFEQAMYDLGASIAENGNDFDIMSESGRANMSALAGVVNAATVSAGNDVNALANMLAQAAKAIGAQGVNIVAKFQVLAQGALNNAAKAAGVAAPQFSKVLAGAMDNQSFAAGYNAKMNDRAAKSAGGAGRGARNAGKGAAAAAKEVRTLTDYVKDLSSVMKNAFDFRWGLEIAVDNAADAFQKLKDMKTDALERVQDAFDKFQDSDQKIKDLRISLADLQADLNGLSADKGTLEYQLSVARDYGDSLREKEILAQLQKVQADTAKAESDRASKTTDLSRAERDQVKASKELSDAQRDVKRDLSGTTAGSREQRDAVRNLVSSYQDQIVELANSGLSSQQLAIETEKLRQKFIAQMVQLGYNRTEAEKYSKSFRDMTAIIKAIPRNITVSANVNPAQRAINEFRAKNTGGRGASAPITTPISSSFDDSGLRRAARANALLAAITGLQADYQRSKSVYVKSLLDQQVARLNSGYYASGGFTGRGGKYETAGIVHKGEYVVPKYQVDQSTGLPYLSALGSIMAGSRSSGSGGANKMGVFPTMMVVELSPTDRKLIQDSGHAIIALDGKVLASSVNSHNANTSSRGL